MAAAAAAALPAPYTCSSFSNSIASFPSCVAQIPGTLAIFAGLLMR